MEKVDTAQLRPTARRQDGNIVNGILFLLPIAVLLGVIFLILFIVAARSGQFDDLDDPPERMLKD